MTRRSPTTLRRCLAPGDAKAHLGRGWAYANKGDPDDAIADYTTAIRLDPKGACRLREPRAVYADKGELDNAIADYTDAARLDPADAKAYYGRALVYDDEGDFDNAIEDYTTAIRLDPKSASAYQNRGVRPREERRPRRGDRRP